MPGGPATIAIGLAQANVWDRGRYSGVTRHVGRWLAKFRHAGQDLNLGHYDAPEQAAWVADFARYMCFGLNPAMWHPRVGRPEFLAPVAMATSQDGPSSLRYCGTPPYRRRC